MKMKQLVFLSAMILMAPGCYAEMTGTVIDAETGQPIEGAVVLVEWSVEKGIPGMMITERIKVTESITDKDGKVQLAGHLNPSVNPPLVVIYKAGYVAWRSDFIFPDYIKRTDFDWQNHYVFKMEKFKKGYLHSKHISFLRMGLRLDASSKLDRAYAWEWNAAEKEMELFRMKFKALRPGQSEKNVWDEIIKELY